MSQTYDVTINIYHPSTSSDDEGHKSDSTDVLLVGPIPARRQFHSYSSVQRLQEGPGQDARKLRLFIVNHRAYPAALQVRTNDRVEVIGDKSYLVLEARPYNSNLQIDTEVYEQ